MKSWIHPYVIPGNTYNKYVSWFYIKGSIFKFNENIACGTVYIPPENSSYSSPKIFNEIENDLLSISINHKYICLLGDFNSRTACADEFYVTTASHINGLEDPYNSEIIETYFFSALSVGQAWIVRKITMANYF